MAEALDHIASTIENAVASGTPFNTAVQHILEETITDHGAIVFNGDGYSEDWQTEAAARGLPNLRTTIDAVPELITEEAQELFDHYGVFSHREMHSRYEIALEHYALSVGVEARSTLELATTSILPAALRYQTELATNAASLQAIGYEFDTTTLDEVSKATSALQAAITGLREDLAHEHPETIFDEAKHACDDHLPAMAAVRSAADELEGLVADDLWPLATYQEMLFIL
jgi:glutamine synthetase